MADLLVRGVDDAVAAALKARARAHGRSTEAEHRALLAEALTRPRRRTFAQALLAMPNVGNDEDFARIEDANPAPDVLA
jgi:antitoxin FitA